MALAITHSIRQILRARPRAVEILERESGYAIWSHPDWSFEAFCAVKKMDAALVLDQILSLPAVPAGTVWQVKPAYMLIDFLTADHERFRSEDMPALANALNTSGFPKFPDGYILKLVWQEVNHFQAEFIRHMEEEESFLFPKIMRNEACFRFHQLSPEVHKGSVNLYLNLESHRPEAEIQRMITAIRERLRLQSLQEPAFAAAEKTLSLIDVFVLRLNAHADLETKMLFPMAGRLEQELYDGTAPGFSRYIGA